MQGCHGGVWGLRGCASERMPMGSCICMNPPWGKFAEPYALLAVQA